MIFIYKMGLISAEEYKNAEVDFLRVKEKLMKLRSVWKMYIMV